jgi:transcriptional regulator with XRE-family HTH domain
MEKTKLIRIRKQKGFSQQYVAEHLCMDVSNYNKREKGKAKINSTEWEKLAKILEVSVEDIYESEESTFIICKDQSVGINHGTNNVYTIPASFLENQKKYITKLEEENAQLKERLK